jgi:quinol monooxygenase YgiN
LSEAASGGASRRADFLQCQLPEINKAPEDFPQFRDENRENTTASFVETGCSSFSLQADTKDDRRMRLFLCP